MIVGSWIGFLGAHFLINKKDEKQWQNILERLVLQNW